ncbi:MAG TPA: hypothetical protein VLL76_05430 [Candidatus Omnitrophota bacterium]|nr:hypothetical protein [Candidatus Omnitrophota bacterium]
MENKDFVFGYLPFWIVTYGTAVVAWSCVGRFLLEMIVPPQSSNYILKWFQRLTNWAIRLTKLVTPAFFHTRYLPLITFYWTYVVRFVLTTWLLTQGMVPAITQGAAP